MANMKACPYCAEQIQDAAIICRFCNRDQPLPAPSKTEPSPAVNDKDFPSGAAFTPQEIGKSVVASQELYYYRPFYVLGWVVLVAGLVLLGGAIISQLMPSAPPPSSQRASAPTPSQPPSSSTDSSYAYSKARADVADLKSLGMILEENGDTFVVADMWYQLPSETHKHNLVANCHVAHEGRPVRIIDGSGRLVATAEGGRITIIQ